jgi:hypothetical protein
LTASSLDVSSCSDKFSKEFHPVVVARL